jgi:hypothetical protein
MTSIPIVTAHPETAAPIHRRVRMFVGRELGDPDGSMIVFL